MNHTFFMNVLIVALVAMLFLCTGNPLAIFGLMFLMDLPYGLHPAHLAAAQMQHDMESESDFPDKPVGFTAQVK